MMTALVRDADLVARLRAERQEARADRRDEVWDGLSIFMPLPDNRHQELIGGLTAVLYHTIEMAGLGDVRPGVNVSDREDDWTENYRCPDVVVFRQDTRAINRDTHWFGGPDFLIEVVSLNDGSREKLDFYARVNVRELLLVDRYPWALELHRLRGGRLVPVARSTVEAPDILACEVVPLSLRLVAGNGAGRPRVAVTHRDGGQRWVL